MRTNTLPAVSIITPAVKYLYIPVSPAVGGLLFYSLAVGILFCRTAVLQRQECQPHHLQPLSCILQENIKSQLSAYRFLFFVVIKY